jgi:hypothetical protein
MVLKDSEFSSRLRRGLEMWFGATPELALNSAPFRREAGWRLIEPDIDYGKVEMSSKTILGRHEPEFREMVASKLEKYDQSFVLKRDGLSSLDRKSTPTGARGTVDAVRDIRSGISGSRPSAAWTDDLAIDEWRQLWTIDALGNGTTEFSFKLRNISQEILHNFDMPFWYGGDRPIADLTTGELTSTVSAEPWEAGVGGSFTFPFEKPLSPGSETEMHCRCHLPNAFVDEDEWVEWYFHRPHNLYTVDIVFDSVWLVSDVRPSCPDADDPARVSFSPPTLDHEGIHWVVHYPSRGQRYRLDWKMERTPGGRSTR